jgi:hypothetical protein
MVDTVDESPHRRMATDEIKRQARARRQAHWKRAEDRWIERHGSPREKAALAARELDEELEL